MLDEFEYVDEEPVIEDDYEIVNDDSCEYVRDENTVVTINDAEVIVPTKEYERYRVYASLTELANITQKELRGYVTRLRNSWYLSGAPGIPFTKVYFVNETPQVNSYIRIKRSKKKISKRVSGSRFEYEGIIVLDWEYDEPPIISTPMKYKEYKDTLLSGMEFINTEHEELFVMGTIGSPYMFANRIMLIGGIRAVVYRDYYHILRDTLKELYKPLPKPVYKVTSFVYRDIRTRTTSTLEKIANKSYSNISMPEVPVESIGILKRVENKDPYELRELREHIFSVKILTPYIHIGEKIHEYSKRAYNIFQQLIERDPFTGTILAYFGINDTLNAVIRLASTIARKELRKKVTFNDIDLAIEKLRAAFEDLSPLIGNIVTIMTPKRIGNLIIELIKRHGNTLFINNMRTKCLELKFLKEELLKYGIHPQLLDNIVSYLRFTKKEIIIHKDHLCLVNTY